MQQCRAAQYSRNDVCTITNHTSVFAIILAIGYLANHAIYVHLKPIYKYNFICFFAQIYNTITYIPNSNMKVIK